MRLDEIRCDRCGELAWFGFGGGVCEQCGDNLCKHCAQWDKEESDFCEDCRNENKEEKPDE